MQLIVIKISDISKNPEVALLNKKNLQNKFVSTEWKQVRSQSRGRKVVVLLGANDVVLTSVDIPSKNHKQLVQAIPYALEDTLAEDIDNLHFSSYQDSRDSNISSVAIISREALITILDKLKSNGISPNYILPTVLAQKFEKNSWSILFENTDNEIIASVRTDTFNGFICHQNILDMFLTESLEKQTPNAIYTNTKPENLSENLQELATHFIDSDLAEYKSTISAFPINLLTNFERYKKSSYINWRAWQPVAVIGCLLAATWTGIFFWQNTQLQKQSQQLSSQMKLLYKNTFPQGRIVDAPAQMSANLKKLKTNVGKTIDSPLPLIANIGPLLKEYKDMILSEVRYQENNLSMTIESPNITRLETFKRDAAKKQNLKIEIKDSTTTSNKVKAVIQITPLPNKTAKEDSETGVNS